MTIGLHLSPMKTSLSKNIFWQSSEIEAISRQKCFLKNFQISEGFSYLQSNNVCSMWQLIPMSTGLHLSLSTSRFTMYLFHKIFNFACNESPKMFFQICQFSESFSPCPQLREVWSFNSASHHNRVTFLGIENQFCNKIFLRDVPPFMR